MDEPRIGGGVEDGLDADAQEHAEHDCHADALEVGERGEADDARVGVENLETDEIGNEIQAKRSNKAAEVAERLGTVQGVNHGELRHENNYAVEQQN